MVEIEDFVVSFQVKMSILTMLLIQTTVYTLLRRYSGGVLEETWSKSSVLMVGEVIKLVFSMLMTISDTGNDTSSTDKMKFILISSPQMFAPAVIYWIMNLLSYVSLDRVDATTFTVCSQMKILTTAIFSFVVMGRTFHPRKCRALLLLVLGVILVSNGTYVGTDIDSQANGDKIIGVAAVLVEVTLSGFVNVLFEKVLKSRIANLSVWDRNFQLAMYSIVLYLPVALREEGPFFHGWTINAVILAVLGGVGGLLVALTMKYTDAVMKTFATSGSIIVTAGVGYVFMGDPMDIPIGVGAICTILALLNYGESVPILVMKSGEESEKFIRVSAA